MPLVLGMPTLLSCLSHLLTECSELALLSFEKGMFWHEGLEWCHDRSADKNTCQLETLRQTGSLFFQLQPQNRPLSFEIRTMGELYGGWISTYACHQICSATQKAHGCLLTISTSKRYLLQFDPDLSLKFSCARN